MRKNPLPATAVARLFGAQCDKAQTRHNSIKSPAVIHGPNHCIEQRFRYRMSADP